MSISPLAGKVAPKELLVDLAALERAYFDQRPDPDNRDQLVQFGTSGHRGSSLNGSFTEAHILAITQAICEHRVAQGIDGPVYMGRDTHALSGVAQRTALEVLAANGVETVIQRDDGVTPTPVISRAILVHNRDRKGGIADGILITPSHNPPEDGGFKYNPPNGGPADTDVTRWVQDRANALLRERQSRGEAGAVRDGIGGRDDPRRRFHPALRRRPRRGHRHGGDQRRRAAARRRSAGRGGGALLGADGGDVQARHYRREPEYRPDLRLHDDGP